MNMYIVETGANMPKHFMDAIQTNKHVQSKRALIGLVKIILSGSQMMWPIVTTALSRPSTGLKLDRAI